MVEFCPNVYNVLKLEERINTWLSMIPSTHFIVLEWARMFTQPKFCTLRTKSMTRPKNLEVIPPDIGDPIATYVECEHHCNLWKSLKIWYDTFISIGCVLHTALENAISDQLKPVQQIRNYGFRNFTVCDIVNMQFHTFGCATQTDSAKIDNTIKHLWDPNKQI